MAKADCPMLLTPRLSVGLNEITIMALAVMQFILFLRLKFKQTLNSAK